MIPHVNDSKKEVEENFVEPKLITLKWYHYVLLNKTLKVAIVFTLLAIVAPIVILRFYSNEVLLPSDGLSTGSCVLQRELRLPCGRENVTSSECHSQCCYDYNHHVCYNRYPSRFSYLISGDDWEKDMVLRPRVLREPYADQLNVNIKLSIDEISATHMSIAFYDATVETEDSLRINNKEYSYSVTTPEMKIEVETAQGTIFNTIHGPMIASDNIWEIAFKLTDEIMFGLGEIPLTTGQVKVIYNHRGDWSAIPLIFAKLNNSYHALLLTTEAPTELSIRSGNQIVIRSITKSGLKFHLFTGPQPKNITNDVIKLIGSDNKLQYWMLGPHICSETTNTVNEAFEEFNEFITNAETEKLPYDSHCGVKPIVFENRYGSEEDIAVFNNGVALLRRVNKRYVPHVSPYIRFEDITYNETTSEEIEDTNQRDYNVSDDKLLGYEHTILRHQNTSNFYKGSIDNLEVVYPDYKNVSTNLFMRLWEYDTDLDGVVLENTWPLDESSKVFNQTYLDLPYFNTNFEQAFNYTVQWNVTLADDSKYFYGHNEYGNNFAHHFKNITNKEIPSWLTSQWMNGDVAVNRQNIEASWTNLRRELSTAALGGISGHKLWSSPVCGDTGNFDRNTQASLCVKWYMAATYMPLIKIHSKFQNRDPLSLIGINKVRAINAIKTRLSLLPYFYTSLQQGPLLRPMFYQYPTSEALTDLSTQFCVGDDLLIIPNLQPNQSHIHFTMPPGNWYEFWSGLKIEGDEGDVITMTTTDADLLTLVRGGSIISIQKNVQETAEDTRLQSDYSVIVALHCFYVNVTNPDDILNPIQNRQCEASNTLYINENLTFVFEADLDKLSITALNENFDAICESNAISSRFISEVNVYGLDELENNYDHHKQISTSIDLCNLRTKSEEILLFSI